MKGSETQHTCLKTLHHNNLVTTTYRYSTQKLSRIHTAVSQDYLVMCTLRESRFLVC